MVAMMNPLDTTQFNRLKKSIDWSKRQLEFPRRNRRRAIRQFIGYHHVEDGSPRRVIVPFLKMIIDIHVRLLAARAPRALFSTKHHDLRWTAASLELAVNEIPQEIKLEVTLRRLVLEALFSIGVAKCGLHTVGNVLGHEYGAPFVDVVTMDDLVIDMAASYEDQLQYIGNDYWLNYEDVMESKSFKKRGPSELVPDDFTMISDTGEQQTQSLAIRENAELFKEKILLRDVKLPSEGLMVTYAVKSGRRLRTVEWTGPERGPYYMLRFGNVPGNLLPIAPIASWQDTHELANTVYRKLANQADSQKTVYAFASGNDAAVQAYKAAGDGDAIFYDGPPPLPMKSGGVEPSTLAFFLNTKDLISYFAGNIDSAGGLSPQSKTLGQDKLIAEASGAQMREMASQVARFAEGIFEALAYYEWHDPVRRRNLRKPIPGTDLELMVPWDRSTRQGEFDLFDIKVDVFSMQDDSPGAKWQRLLALLKEVVFPLIPAIRQDGGALDSKSLIELGAKWQDVDEIGEIVRFLQQPEVPGVSKTTASIQNTMRQTERINRPGATESGKSQILQQVLLGGRPQKDEMDAIGRATG